MPDAPQAFQLLLKKRDGGELSRSEVEIFVRAVVHRDLSEAQIASFLMAIFQRGLTLAELAALTEAMRRSGASLTAPPHTYTIDKHSTGGVGDKTSLLIAPILAAAATAAASHPNAGLPRLAVPMISGRSLGHTGGTLDKLESIPGFNTELSLERIAELLPQTHAVLVGQTPDLVPADRILYALRDHTGTVESPSLITASIMSKKLAEDLRGLVLDIKTGSGAFMPTYDDAKALARLMVATGEAAGTRTVALLTSMEEPLGRFAGNWVEIQECVDILQGRLHPLSTDLVTLTLALSGHMLHLAGHAINPDVGAGLAAQYLQSGKAWQAWLTLVHTQGGDTSIFREVRRYHAPALTRPVTAPQSGYLQSMNCKQVGWAVQRLGAGRLRPGDSVHAHAGLEVHSKVGHFVQQGQPVFTAFSEQEDQLDESCHMLADALQIGPDPVTPAPLIHEIITG